MKKYAPIIFIFITLVVTIYLLYSQGRIWICDSGEIKLWVNDAWSSDNSQHITDPYSFSHLQHGLIFFFLFGWIFSKFSVIWQFAISIFIESIWEVVENSKMIIDRYREATAALGYSGDAIINSMADIFYCGLGFWVAKLLGWKLTLLLFVVIEIMMVLIIKDSLLLNVIMLIYPLDAIREWQMG